MSDLQLVDWEDKMICWNVQLCARAARSRVNNRLDVLLEIAHYFEFALGN